MARHTGLRPRREAEELALPSQGLVEAALRGEAERVEEILSSIPAAGVDVNYAGTVTLRVRSPTAGIEQEEFRTEVTALFAAAHSGHADIARKLLSAGADVNQELFRGYATTAAARQGHCDILGMLLKAGASQSACEDALLEASLCGEAKAVQLLICSDMARPVTAVHALVTACSRGFVDVVTTLVENGVDINCMNRVLLRSSKPVLHANVDCTPLVAAIVSRQVSVVKYLLEAGAKTDFRVRVGAWSWDPLSGDELRVGACLAEPYTAAWCAVEYYEESGGIVKLLLHHQPSLLEELHLGRTLLCHAILCQNECAVSTLLEVGANPEFPIITKTGYEALPIHLAARLGCIHVIRRLISHGCDVNARTSTGETPLMISARFDRRDCFSELLISGGDSAMVSDAGESPIELAKRSMFGSLIIDIISEVLISGARICSTNPSVFSPIHFVAESGNAEVLQMILRSSLADLDKFDGVGLTPLMIAAKAGHMEAFRILVMAGANIAVETLHGETVMSIGAEFRDQFEEILLDAVLAEIMTDRRPFRALHYAARKGELPALVQLVKMGYAVDCFDDDGYSPLMLAAIGGHSEACKILLLKGGADCELINERKETALSLSRRSNKATEGVLLDQLARRRVIGGAELCKHTREGRGPPHVKAVRMIAESGVLTWGKGRRRNVVCKEAAAGPSSNFSKNRRTDEGMLIFRVLTATGREVHFEANCGSDLELWVRGINLVAKEKGLA